MEMLNTQHQAQGIFLQQTRSGKISLENNAK
jgi:hypothetical protein